MYSVLVVDDETIVRLAVRKIISNADCEFQVVGEGENGKQALKCYEDYGDIDIILTDITMPILNGLELTRELMKKENPPIVVAISSYNDYDLVREAFKLGAKDYILKSNLNEETLLNLLNKLVENERITRQRQDRSLKYEKEMLLKSWLDGQKTDDYQEPFKSLKIKLNAEDITVCSVLIDDFQEIKERHGLWDRADLYTLMQDTLSQLLDGNRQGEVLTEDDRTYLYTGFCMIGDRSRSGPMATVLGSDMLTIVEEAVFIAPSEPDSEGSTFVEHEFFEAPSIRKRGNTYYFI